MDPGTALVGRRLETRWEHRLRELADAEAELAEQTKPGLEPSREQLEALARDLPALWAADSTAVRDRKRLLRTMIADATLTSPARGTRADGRDPLALERLRAPHHPAATRPADAKRTPAKVIALIKQLAADHTNAQIPTNSRPPGCTPSTGLPPDEKAVRWLRWCYRILTAPEQLLGHGEITAAQLALGVTNHLLRRGDRVVPLGVEVVAGEVDGGDLIVCDLDLLGVFGWVEAGVDLQAGAGGRRGDQVDDDLVADQWLCRAS